MNVGDAITWQTILTLIAVLGPVGGLWWKLNKQDADERESRILAFGAMKAQLSAFELDVARNYATTTSIRDAVEPITKQLDNITQRLDRVLEQQNSPRN